MYDSNHSLLERETLVDLVTKAQNGCNESMEEIIKHNVRLVEKIVKNYGKLGEKEELMQEGVLGLCEAVERFDVDKNIAFSTYATIRIRRKIGYFLKANRTIRIPHWVYGTERINQYKKLTGTTSLNKMIGEGIELEELLGNDDKEIAEMESKEILDQMMARLDSREKYIVTQSCIEENTLAEIGRVLGVSRERVRQIKCIALNKMKKRGITDEIESTRFD